MTGIGADNDRWVYPRGRASSEPSESSASSASFDPEITSAIDGWRHTSLRVATLAPGAQVTVSLPTTEVIVVPLRGGVRVSASHTGVAAPVVDLAGRRSVFAGSTDVAYVAAGAEVSLLNRGEDEARIALCGAETETSGTANVLYLAASDVPVEQRGAGQASRLVRNFGTPDVLDAQRIIACEVITPGGNWSSYPPHKHDEERPGVETELEEIYYFELQVEQGTNAPADPSGATDPVGYQRVYGTAERPIDVIAEVHSGDVVLVPHGWHGPATAPPGYDLYYLNVMAGPGAERAWLISDDPAHGWVRSGWEGQEVDPRVRSRYVDRFAGGELP